MADAIDGVRLDIWLDVACLFRTRSEAQKACKSGKIDVNGQPAKPNRLLRVGDELLVGRPFGRNVSSPRRGPERLLRVAPTADLAPYGYNKLENETGIDWRDAESIRR